ncbi:hypothetical protein ACUXST_000095 [Sphingomonas sp. F9_3S_D5_B_2]
MASAPVGSINMIEGLVEDVAKGKLANIPGEMRIRAEWEHNKKGLATKVVTLGAVAFGLHAVFGRRKSSGSDQDEEPEHSSTE